MNINNRLKKRDFTDYVNRNPEKIVKMWTLPKGAICRTLNIDGVNVLENGMDTICQSSIVDAMVEHGIDGVVIIDSTSNSSPTIPRWVRYYFTEKTIEDVAKAPEEIVVTTLTNMNIKEGLPFMVKTVLPIDVKASEVINVTRKLAASDNSIDLFLIEDENGQIYQYEPQRNVYGVIVAYTDNGYVVHVGNSNVIQLVSRVSLKMREVLIRMEINPKDIVGSKVAIQYTSFMGDGCTKPYKSAMIVHIHSVMKLAVRGVDYAIDGGMGHIEPIFERKHMQRSSIITPTRLAEAVIARSDDMIWFYDHYSNSPIAILSKGKENGTVSVVINDDGKEDIYSFKTPYDCDSLLYKSFNHVIGSAIREKVGVNVVKAGLYYVIDDEEMLNCGLLYPKVNQSPSALQLCLVNAAFN